MITSQHEHGLVDVDDLGPAYLVHALCGVLMAADNESVFLDEP